MSAVAEKRSVEQPIGTRALWNDPWLAEKCRHGLNTEPRRGEEILSDCLIYDIPKDYYGVFTEWHQKQTAYPDFK